MTNSNSTTVNLSAQRALDVLRQCGIAEDRAVALTASLEPQDEYERTTALQIVAAQQMSLRLMADAAAQDFLPAKRQLVRMATDLMSKQTMLVDALHRHRASVREERGLEATEVSE